MSIQVGKLYKNRLVKDLGGNIIDWFDEANGGWIIQKGVVVNPEIWQKHLQKEADKREAAKAIGMQKIDESLPDRNGSPKEIEELKKGMEDLKKDVDDKFSAILNLLEKPKKKSAKTVKKKKE